MKIENIKYNSFDEFLTDVILPTGELKKKLDGFIFRGERTSKRKLLPGALREEQVDKVFAMSKPIGEQWKWLTHQFYAEYSLLREFYKSANHNGLKVPKVDSIDKNYVDVFPTELFEHTGYIKWISDDIAELAALAQHYGVLTRLIDWSFEIYVALYFASIGAIKNRKKEIFDTTDTIVIWALNDYYIQFLQPTVSRIPLKFVVPSYYNNPNLNAQKGILSYWEVDVPSMRQLAMDMDNFIALTDRTPLDVLLQRYCKSNSEKDNDLTLLYKFEFPVTDCFAAYGFVRDMNYTAARLFPGYSGIVQDMDEISLFFEVKKKEEEYLSSRN